MNTSRLNGERIVRILTEVGPGSGPAQTNVRRPGVEASGAARTFCREKAESDDAKSIAS